MTVISQQATARKLGVSRWTVKRWAEQRIIPRKCYLEGIGGKKVFIEEQIDKWLGADK